uniref:Uncharacterized protein n=1 Tax=Odontella aurita TaxID=265563 RepID=A0A7S4IK54_9STRA
MSSLTFASAESNATMEAKKKSVRLQLAEEVQLRRRASNVDPTGLGSAFDSNHLGIYRRCCYCGPWHRSSSRAWGHGQGWESRETAGGRQWRRNTPMHRL